MAFEADLKQQSKLLAQKITQMNADRARDLVRRPVAFGFLKSLIRWADDQQ
jgi:hypothetical protein